ncbi:MAG: 16S rRNA (adenine(1518)-N(6)/adenine(1519)-N(6))-dimethyltransferase RsmA [Bacteroidetes bacterium]|jgi:16S rRNA (adenine1518-N6/adenine1519-N6)-dimethyltransferase|nr:16S rRNA (adenine(1518)-N(6)/adenine(1519)-N(6))-dimethyltransferase RsmA [Bacteroidota bacterium]
MKHSHTVKAKKHLGQHFLADQHTAHRIADSLVDPNGMTVLEIGPGTGALTRPLLERSDLALWAIEVDHESILHLQQQDWMPSDRILEGDFLHMPLSDSFGDQQVIICGNFPYNISSQILFKTLDSRQQVPQLVGMFQKEVAERVCSKHGSKVYGILSVLIQTYYDAEYLFTVPPEVFIPPPKVHSGVLRLVRKSEQPTGFQYSHLKTIVKAAFNQRRKTLRNALRSAGISLDGIDATTLGLRAEQLSPESFQELARIIRREQEL